MPRKKATKKKAAKPVARVPAAERAQASGFHVKLDAWLAANEKAKREGAVHYGPHSAERLAKVLSALGEKVNPGTVLRWRDGSTLPESRYVALLEQLLGAPWSYLDDAKTPWPRRWTKEAVADLLGLLPDGDVDALVQALERRAAPPAPGASLR
ncbi:MAG: hypothetical protein H6826_15405 [Planctomycetes bacterium]|nr:hypothetical protein [Planctomycetota bacterium]MCB9901554.1 hypothetical protein [Planctomycetota bacterium]MCB9902729.1 hypothetical protein [Planctomycetota bacterium]